MTESLSPSAPPAAMIDFRCPNCQKLLRIAAAAAGKQAQCPECRTSMIVPTPSSPASNSASAPIDGAAQFAPQAASDPSPNPLAPTPFAPAPPGEAAPINHL